MRVGLQRDKVTDVRASATALADALGVDADALVKAVRGAGPKQFVEAQTLRKDDYAAKEAELDGIEGLLAVDATAPLAPTRAFARARLGGIRPATAEQVEGAEGPAAPGSARTRRSSCRKDFDERLAECAGAPHPDSVDAQTSDPCGRCASCPRRTARTVPTTLSRPAQDASRARPGRASAPRPPRSSRCRPFDP